MELMNGAEGEAEQARDALLATLEELARRRSWVRPLSRGAGRSAAGVLGLLVLGGAAAAAWWWLAPARRR